MIFKIWKKLKKYFYVNIDVPPIVSYNIVVFHNGKRNMYQIIKKTNNKLTLMGEPYYSAAWANQKIQKLLEV